jgi:hypothetical protein
LFASGGSAFLVLSRRFGGYDLVVVTDLVLVAEVEDGGSGDGGVWVQIQVEVVGGMLWFGVAGVGVLATDLLCFQLCCRSSFYVCLFFAVVKS